MVDFKKRLAGKKVDKPMNRYLFRGLLVVAIMAVGFTAVPPCHAQVTSNVLRRTLLIQGSMVGTAFTIDIDGRQYLITAKHVVGKLKDEAESTIQIRKKTGWAPLKVTVFKCSEPVDIAVLVPPTQITVDHPLEATSQGLAAGQDAYFVGFPYGGFTTYSTLPDVFGFVKRATVSQFVRVSENDRAQIIQLDGYNNPGFSGSPVVFRDLNQSGLAA